MWASEETLNIYIERVNDGVAIQAYSGVVYVLAVEGDDGPFWRGGDRRQGGYGAGGIHHVGRRAWAWEATWRVSRSAGIIGGPRSTGGGCAQERGDGRGRGQDHRVPSDASTGDSEVSERNTGS